MRLILICFVQFGKYKKLIHTLQILHYHAIIDLYMLYFYLLVTFELSAIIHQLLNESCFAMFTRDIIFFYLSMEKSRKARQVFQSFCPESTLCRG